MKKRTVTAIVLVLFVTASVLYVTGNQQAIMTIATSWTKAAGGESKLTAYEFYLIALRELDDTVYAAVIGTGSAEKVNCLTWENILELDVGLYDSLLMLKEAAINLLDLPKDVMLNSWDDYEKEIYETLVTVSTNMKDFMSQLGVPDFYVNHYLNKVLLAVFGT